MPAPLIMYAELWQTPVKALSKPTLGTSKIITLAAFSGASLLFKKPVQCQGKVNENWQHAEKLLNTTTY